MAVSALDDPTRLLGEWAFTRVIDDRRGNERSRVEGRTVLEAEGDRIRWRERGTLRWRDERIEVFRTLFLQMRDAGWWVTFEDGRDFHPWAPGESVEHLCGADVYAGRIFGEGEGWVVEWTVTGPAKDYTMTTELTRRRAPHGDAPPLRR